MPKTKKPTRARMLREIVTPEGFKREVRTEPKTQWEPAFKVLTFKSSDIEIEIWFNHGRDGYFLASGHVSFDTASGRRSFDRTGVEDSFYIENPEKWDQDARPWTGDRVVYGHHGWLGTVTQSAGYREFGANRANSWSDEYEIIWDGDDSPPLTIYTSQQLKDNKIVKADVIEQTNARIKKFIEVKIPEARARIDRSETVPGIPFLVTPETKKKITRMLKAQKLYTFMPSGFGTGYTLGRHCYPGYLRAIPETEQFFGVSPLYVTTFVAD